MKMDSSGITRSIIIFSIWMGIITATPGAFGQSDNWPMFEETLFQVIDELVRNIVREDVSRDEIASLQERLEALDTLLISYIRQKTYPSIEACHVMKQFLLTSREVVRLPPGGVFPLEDGRKIVFLREAVQQYSSEHQLQNLPEKGEQATNQLHFSIAYIYRPAGTKQFKHLPNGGVLRSGDAYKIIFQSEQTCYVYIFQADASGKIYGLFPLEHFRGTAVNLFNPVQAGTTYFVPGEHKSFRLDEQIGQERLYFLAFRQPDRTLETLYNEILRAQNAGHPEVVPELRERFLAKLESKGPAVIVVDPEKTEPVSFLEEGMLFSILRQRLEGMCDGCVNMLTFTHQ